MAVNDLTVPLCCWNAHYLHHKPFYSISAPVMTRQVRRLCHLISLGSPQAAAQSSGNKEGNLYRMFLWSAIQVAEVKRDGNGSRKTVAFGKIDLSSYLKVPDHIWGCSLGKWLRRHPVPGLALNRITPTAPRSSVTQKFLLSSHSKTIQLQIQLVSSCTAVEMFNQKYDVQLYFPKCPYAAPSCVKFLIIKPLLLAG